MLFFPPMTGGHMGIQILHSTEGMIAGLTPLHMAKERPFSAGFWLQVVICSLIDFLTPNHFAQKRTDKDLIRCRLFRTRSDPCMLSQSLLCSILPTTLLTNELRPLDAAFLVSLQHAVASQQLGTIAAGELLPPCGHPYAPSISRVL